jgi:class 3 adenylate cyclase
VSSLAQGTARFDQEASSELRERREVTVVFCDLAGYTEWNEEAEPEEVALVMDRIKQRAVQTFEAYGGVANQFVGDEVLGLFGIATSHDDDPSRAVLATRSLHDFVRSQSVVRASGEPRALLLHSGIETGVVYVRMRDSRSGLWEVTGDTVNIAARLRALAGPDELLVGPATRRSIEPYFVLAAREPARVKGKAQLLPSFAVQRALAPSSRFEAARVRGLTDYVGRDDALEQLHAAFAEASAGRGGLLLVEGPPGIGKSRLFYEFRKQVERTRAAAFVFQGRCIGYGEVSAYQPFVQALLGSGRRELRAGQRAVDRMRRFELVSDASMSVMSYLLSPESLRTKLGLEGDLLRDAIVDALIEAVQVAAARRPLLLMLEDWHWADEPSRAALRRMAQAIAGHRVLIAVNQRSGVGSEPLQALASRSISLSLLDEPTTEAIACALLSVTELPAGLTHFLHERTLGNPLFIEEICRSLLEAGVLSLRAGKVVLLSPVSTLRAPASVQAIVRARVDRLSSSEKALLRAAAAIGVEFTLELLASLVGEGEAIAEARLLQLEVQGLLFRTNDGQSLAYRFKHAITQEVAYESIPHDERRWLHGQIARTIEQRAAVTGLAAQYETLAHHYGRSTERAKAIEFALLAGDKASRSFSLEPASAHYRRAIELLDLTRIDSADKAQRRVDASVSWARVGVYSPQIDQVTALRRARQLAHEFGNELGACLCLNWQSWIEHALGDQLAARETCIAYLAHAQKLGNPALISQALTNLGLSHAMAADYERAVGLLGVGAARPGTHVGTAYAYALGYLALIAGDQGDFATAYRHLTEAGKLVERAGLLIFSSPLLLQRALVEYWHGAWDACRASARAALEIAERIDGPYIRALALTLIGAVQHAQSDDREALELIREAQAILEGKRIALHASFNYAALAEALSRAGQHDEANTFASRAMRRAEAGDRLGEVMSLRVLARGQALGARDLLSACAYYERALQAAIRKGSDRELAQCKLCWAELQLAHGNHNTAHQLLDEANALFNKLGMRQATLP